MSEDLAARIAALEAWAKTHDRYCLLRFIVLAVTMAIGFIGVIVKV